MADLNEYNWFITGGNGFIGQNLIARIRKYYPYCGITSLDAQPASHPNFHKANKVKWSRHNLTNFPLNLIEDPCICVHLAANTCIQTSIQDPIHNNEVNVYGTLQLLNELAKRNNPLNKFIFASSAAVIGNHECPHNEQSPTSPISPYGVSKLAGEKYCSAFTACKGMRTLSLRFSNVYGNYSAHKTSVVSNFINSAYQTGEININGTGTQTRDFIHVNDIAEAIVSLVDLEDDVLDGGVYHICTGKEVSINDLAKYIDDLYYQFHRQHLTINHKEALPNEVQRNYSSNNKLYDTLFWKPEISLKSGLASTFKWFDSYYQLLKTFTHITDPHI